MFNSEDSSLKLTPKLIFLAGVILTVLVIGTGGFIWTLAGGSFSKTLTSPTALGVNNNQPTDQPTANVVQPVNSADHIRGNEKAKVTLITYSDTECPYCKNFHETMQQIYQTYGNKIAWVYRHFPLTQLHPKAPKEAEATECAGELGGNTKFWAYLDKIFEVTPSNNGLDAAQLPIIAEQIGLDKTKFETCLNSGKYTNKIQAAMAAAAAAGAQGTPYTVILAGDQKIPVEGAVPVEQLKATIDQLLK